MRPSEIPTVLLVGLTNGADFTQALLLNPFSPPAELLPSWSPRSSGGFQWLSGLSGRQDHGAGIQEQTRAAFTQLQSKKNWAGSTDGDKMHFLRTCHSF